MAFVFPLIVKGKILMQELWMQKIDWDTEISSLSLLQEYQDFTHSILQLSQMSISAIFVFRKAVHYN